VLLIESAPVPKDELTICDASGDAAYTRERAKKIDDYKIALCQRPITDECILQTELRSEG
jgi:hypothetical protein